MNKLLQKKKVVNPRTDRMKSIQAKIASLSDHAPKERVKLLSNVAVCEKLYEDFKKIEGKDLVERGKKRNYDTKIKKSRARLLYRCQDYVRSEKAFVEAIEDQKNRKYPHDDELCHLSYILAKLYRHIGRYEDAVQLAGEVEKYFSGIGNTYFSVPKKTMQAHAHTIAGHGYVQLGKYSEASKEFGKAQKYLKNERFESCEKFSFYFDYADFLRRNGKIDDARKLLIKHSKRFSFTVPKSVETVLRKDFDIRMISGSSGGLGGVSDFAKNPMVKAMALINECIFPELAYLFVEWGKYAYYLNLDETAKMFLQLAFQAMKVYEDEDSKKKVNFFYRNISTLMIFDEEKNEKLKKLEVSDFSSRDLKDVLQRAKIEYKRTDSRDEMERKVLEYAKSKTSINSCNVCGKGGELMRCSICKAVFYCSRECQRKDWKKHRLGCKKN